MRKEFKKVFNGFLGVEKQKSISFSSQDTSSLRYDFKETILNTTAEKINTIELEHEINNGDYSSFLIEEYSFSFFKIEKNWYCLAWIYSFYGNKEALFNHMKKRIVSSKLLKDVQFGYCKSYGESNFISMTFSSFSSELMNKINIEKERFNYLLSRDYRKSNYQELVLNEVVESLYNVIGLSYINKTYTERKEIIDLLETKKDGTLSENSIDLVELNHAY